jgi:hypothetical protein
MFCIFSHTVLDELQFHLYMPRFISEKCGEVQRYLGVCQVRNSFSDGCDITVKTGADLAKAGESQVTFAAFNSTKISSV